jgi:hypothetical protein
MAISYFRNAESTVTSFAVTTSAAKTFAMNQFEKMYLL